MMNPFVNESEALEIGDLKIENRIDRVTVYGRIDITWDKEGLRNARELRRIFTRIAHALERADALPSHLPPPEEPIIKPNPFVESTVPDVTSEGGPLVIESLNEETSS